MMSATDAALARALYAFMTLALAKLEKQWVEIGLPHARLLEIVRQRAGELAGPSRVARSKPDPVESVVRDVLIIVEANYASGGASALEISADLLTFVASRGLES